MATLRQESIDETSQFSSLFNLAQLRGLSSVTHTALIDRLSCARSTILHHDSAQGNDFVREGRNCCRVLFLEEGPQGQVRLSSPVLHLHGVTLISSRRLRPWTRTDIEKFQKDDPQHGNNVKALRNAGILTAVGELPAHPVACRHEMYILRSMLSAGSLGGGVAGGAFTFSRGGTLNGSIFTGLIGACRSSLFDAAATFSIVLQLRLSVFSACMYRSKSNQRNCEGTLHPLLGHRGHCGSLIHDYDAPCDFVVCICV